MANADADTDVSPETFREISLNGVNDGSSPDEGELILLIPRKDEFLPAVTLPGIGYWLSFAALETPSPTRRLHERPRPLPCEQCGHAEATHGSRHVNDVGPWASGRR